MKRLLTLVCYLLFFSNVMAQNDMNHFIKRSGDRLLENGKVYRFITFNTPNLHLVEDNMAFTATNEWRFPDEFEIKDALESIKQMGGRATRTYVISICRKTGPNPIPCHVKKPDEFNEEAFRALDKVLEVANKVGVRVVIPFVDNWVWWGGIKEYAEYRNKSADDFWTDREIIEDFKKTVNYVINRRNTYTGTLYKDDKAILAWETGNELYSRYSWTKEIAAYIKSLDSNHLVWDGFYIGNREIQPEALEDPNIDIVSSHHYPATGRHPDTMADDIIKFNKQIAGKKVYAVGEFGFVPLSSIEKILNAVIQNDVAGAMIWSLRFHNRDGGFYFHSEGSGGNLYKAYHYPGFKTADAYDETKLLRLMRAKAYEINGLPVPQLTAPVPPVLLPIKTVAAISWQGSVGASGYDVERTTKPNGQWTVVGMNVDDTLVAYSPLFADNFAEQGQSYYYRVRARNEAGISAPSNIVGPVRVQYLTTVDELMDYSHIFASDGNFTIEMRSARPYKEDTHRLKGSSGWIMYRTKQPLRAAKIRVFMEGEEKDFEFYVSQDGSTFNKLAPAVSRFPTEVNPYGYKLPMQYEINKVAANNYFLKIVFRTAAQISRVEIESGR